LTRCNAKFHRIGPPGRETASGREGNFGATSAAMSISKETQEAIVVISAGLLLLATLLVIANHFRLH
jgi:hypothetical protein